MLEASKRIRKSNAAGLDGISPKLVPTLIDNEYDTILKNIVNGTYTPEKARTYGKRKTNGGIRTIAINSAIDRCIIACLYQNLYDIITPVLTEHTYAYIKNRGCIEAIRTLARLAKDGYTYFAKIDIEKCFDNIKHDMILFKLKKLGIHDDVLRIINKLLKMDYDNAERHDILGCPQGSATSPILMELVLDSLDKELMRRHLQFIRYADDIIVAYKSKEAAKHGLLSITKILYKKCKLRPNGKSQVHSISEGVPVLGYVIYNDTNGAVHLKPKEAKLKDLYDKLHDLTNSHHRTEVIIYKMNCIIRGWLTYFRHAEISEMTLEIDETIEQLLTRLEAKRGDSIDRSKLISCNTLYSQLYRPLQPMTSIHLPFC
ncbi:MAG: hypothetical protein IKW90_00815 [Lachnospiraceae bacterium]|nr:hypothetical protein [Lachnospiraceae bacterium]